MDLAINFGINSVLNLEWTRTETLSVLTKTGVVNTAICPSFWGILFFDQIFRDFVWSNDKETLHLQPKLKII